MSLFQKNCHNIQYPNSDVYSKLAARTSNIYKIKKINLREGLSNDGSGLEIHHKLTMRQRSFKVVCRGTDESFCIINCPILVGKHVGS